jgi:hypothetical protein
LSIRVRFGLFMLNEFVSVLAEFMT